MGPDASAAEGRSEPQTQDGRLGRGGDTWGGGGGEGGNLCSLTLGLATPSPLSMAPLPWAGRCASRWTGTGERALQVQPGFGPAGAASCVPRPTL